MKITDSDIRHTAEDIEQKEINKYFDIELNAGEKPGYENGVANGKPSKKDLAHINVGFIEAEEKGGKPTVTHM